MSNFVLKHRISTGKNIINPYAIRQGDSLNLDATLTNRNHVPKLKVSGGLSYRYSHKNGGLDTIADTGRYLVLYDYLGQVYDDRFYASGTVINIPTGVFYIDLPVNADVEPSEICFAYGADTDYEPYFTSRVLSPIYQGLKTQYEKGSGEEYYRSKLTGSIELVRGDYDYINNLAFDTEMFLEIEHNALFEKYVGRFFKTNLKFNDDDKIITVSTDPIDDYEVVLGGINKTYNLIDTLPSKETIYINKRPIIQIYIAGDNVVTNVLDGTYWEQEVQTDPIFEHNDLVNTYGFYNTQTVRRISPTLAAEMSTDVTGEYDSSRVNANGLYKVVETQAVPSRAWLGKYFEIVRVSDDVVLYRTNKTSWNNTSISSLAFKGVNGETGSFYFSELRIYTRYVTDRYEIERTGGNYDTYALPSTDIIANNSNYRRVIGYNMGTNRFTVSESSLTVPTKYGKFPDDSYYAGKYYREYQIPSLAGIDRRPIPVSASNWADVSVWYLSDLNIQFTEFEDGQRYSFRDAYQLSSVIQSLLTAMGANITFSNDIEHSEFLYSETCPLGGFSYLETYSPYGNTDYVGNLHYFITPKSNIINSTYDNPAQKADITLASIFKMLRDTKQLYWHIEGGRLRIEHISWYNKGGTYSYGNLVGSDLTDLKSLRNDLPWDFAQNKYEFEKESMAQRYEFGWMDDVSPLFEGCTIDILSNYVEEGKTEDSAVSNATTDVDYIQANPQDISKNGFALVGTVLTDGEYIVPYVRLYDEDDMQFMSQNGFLSWRYLHSKYYGYNLPANSVRINNEDIDLYENISRFKKQKVEYPLFGSINPYKLVKTGLGDGKIDKMTIDMESYMVTGELKNDTE